MGGDLIVGVVRICIVSAGVLRIRGATESLFRIVVDVRTNDLRI